MCHSKRVTVTFLKHKYHMPVMLCKRITRKIVEKYAITVSVMDEKKMCKVVFFSKEAGFTLSRNVNSHNNTQ